MPHASLSDADVEGLLSSLGVESLCQWDALVFLYRHQTTLVGADYLARLLGYATDPIIAALDVLESLGLVDRSRVSRGARLYQFIAPIGPPRGEAFRRLLELADDRGGRLLLSQRLRRADRSSQEGVLAARAFREEAGPVIRQSGQFSRAAQQPARRRARGRRTWLKVI
jgi:hypothetical protein